MGYRLNNFKYNLVKKKIRDPAVIVMYRFNKKYIITITRV